MALGARYMQAMSIVGRILQARRGILSFSYFSLFQMDIIRMRANKSGNKPFAPLRVRGTVKLILEKVIDRVVGVVLENLVTTTAIDFTFNDVRRGLRISMREWCEPPYGRRGAVQDFESGIHAIYYFGNYRVQPKDRRMVFTDAHCVRDCVLLQPFQVLSHPEESKERDFGVTLVDCKCYGTLVGQRLNDNRRSPYLGTKE